MNEMTLAKMLSVVKELGTVKSAKWYDSGYMIVEGLTTDGKKITVSLSVMEVEENA